jgi:cellulose synthase/poly-beta-1,6-N-acetylglucosamine synthase-like glycosyltransferase
MKVCYLWPTLASAEAGGAWARALAADRLELEELAQRVASANARRESVSYDLVLVDLVAEALPRIGAVARLLIPQPGCKLVLHATQALPTDPAELERWRAGLELSDLVICPSHALCADIRAKTTAPAYELWSPCAVDAAGWAAPPEPGEAAPSGSSIGASPGERGRGLTVVTAAPPSHWRLLRELGVLAYASTFLGGRIRWLEPRASEAEREHALSQSGFVYLPAPIEDAGALAADCARSGALLIAHLGYDAAKATFPYTTFDDGHERRRSLLFLWLHSSREFREFFREIALHGATQLADQNRRVQFVRRLEYQFPERQYRLPEAGAPALIDRIVHRQGPLDVRTEARDCLLVCLVRNGQEHIPAFLSHYRELGVRHFFFIDNGSDDATLALLEAQRDVTTYATRLPHKYYEREVRRLIIERHCRGSWCLNVDIDELFDYPMSHELNLVGLLTYLSEQRFTAMAGYLLDMYARENAFGDAGELDLRAAYPYYDISNVTRTDYFAHQVKAFCDHNVLSSDNVRCYFGGIRKTLFGSKTGEEYLLTKHPLIFLDGRLEPVTHPHYSNQARVADVTTVLYHYKFTPSFKAKVEESRASRRYVKFAQGQYDQYQKQIGQRSSLVIDTPGTQRLGSVQDLVDQGFLTTSSAFEAHVRGAARGDRAVGGKASQGSVSSLDAREPARTGLDAVTLCALGAVLMMLALGLRELSPHGPGADAALPAVSGLPAAPALRAAAGLLGALELLVDVLFSIFGVLALMVVVAAGFYVLSELWRRRRLLALGASAVLWGAAFTPLGAWVVSFAAGVVVLANALAYVYLASRTLLGAWHHRRSGGELGAAPSLAAPARPLPRVSVVITARDEEAVIEETLRALDGIDYPHRQLEIVVIDDGSTDQTRARVRAVAAEMAHRVELCAHDCSEGKARRLNQILANLRTDFVLLLDADHRAAPDLLRRMLPHFDAGADVACVQAASAVRNGHINWLTRALEMEYLFRCQGTYPGKPMGIFVGSGGLFRRTALLGAGGFDPSMLTEDVELSYRLYASGKTIVYEPAACTFELATLDFENFFNQRYRWMRGLWQSMLLHAPRTASPAGLRRVFSYFVQCTSDGLVALCLSVLFMYVLLEQVGVVGEQPRLPLYLMMLSCSYAFSVGFIRGKKPGLMLFLPLVPLYSVLHAIPMAWALIDGYVLGKPSVWVKTERRPEAAAAIRLSRGRA